jgi:hypothetical protein
MHLFQREGQFKAFVESQFEFPAFLDRLVSGPVVLLLVFNYCNSLRDLVEGFVASSVEAEHRSLFEKTELLTIVVIDVKFLLDPFHLFEVSDEVRVLR